MNDDEKGPTEQCYGAEEGGVILPGVWPGPINMEGVLARTEDDLDMEQSARASALYHARGVLERRGIPFVGKDASAPPPVADLIRVARFILSGQG